MKAKKQELLKLFYLFLYNQNDPFDIDATDEGELQVVVDNFIDHHDSKKKSKFKVGDIVVIDDGSIFTRSLAKIISIDNSNTPYQLVLLEHENKDFEGREYWVEKHCIRKTNLEKSKFGSDNEQVKLKEEPIQYPSFKVGDSARKYLELCKEFENKALKLIKND